MKVHCNVIEGFLMAIGYQGYLEAKDSVVMQIWPLLSYLKNVPGNAGVLRTFSKVRPLLKLNPFR